MEINDKGEVMAVNLNTNVSFKSTKTDAPSSKPGVIQGAFNTASTVGNIGINVAEYGKAAVGGTLKGIIAGGIVMAGGWFIRKVSKKGAGVPLEDITKIIGQIQEKTPATEISTTLTNLVNGIKGKINTVKGVGTFAKVLAVVTGLGVLGISLIKAKIKVNDRVSKLDHKLNSGHNA
jgi:hypothetical protein